VLLSFVALLSWSRCLCLIPVRHSPHHYDVTDACRTFHGRTACLLPLYTSTFITVCLVVTVVRRWMMPPRWTTFGYMVLFLWIFILVCDTAAAVPCPPLSPPSTSPRSHALYLFDLCGSLCRHRPDAIPQFLRRHCLWISRAFCRRAPAILALPSGDDRSVVDSLFHSSVIRQLRYLRCRLLLPAAVFVTATIRSLFVVHVAGQVHCTLLQAVALLRFGLPDMKRTAFMHARFRRDCALYRCDARGPPLPAASLPGGSCLVLSTALLP